MDNRESPQRLPFYFSNTWLINTCGELYLGLKSILYCMVLNFGDAELWGITIPSPNLTLQFLIINYC